MLPQAIRVAGKPPCHRSECYPGTHQHLIHARRVPLHASRQHQYTYINPSNPTLRKKTIPSHRATAPPPRAATTPLFATTATATYANMLPYMQNMLMYISGCALLMYAFNTVFNKMLGNVRDQRNKIDAERSNTFALEALAVALQQPVRFLLPSAALLLCVRELGRILLQFSPETRTRWGPIIAFISARVSEAEMFTLRYSEVLLIIVVTWMIMGAKSALFERISFVVSDTEGVAMDEVTRALTPVSDLLSWAIGGGSLVVLAQVFGFNMTPVLLTGGIGGAIAALASQSFLANIVSGINLFVSRPFVVGDRIIVKGAVNVHGIVEAIDYTRTLVRVDQLLPVLIPNKTLQEAVIINESRAGNSAVRNNYVGPRNLNFSFQMPYKDMDKADKITAEIRRWAREECDLVDNRYALYAWVTGFTDNTCTISINLYSTTPASRAFASFREIVLINVFRIVRSYGASIANYHIITNFEYNMGSLPQASNGASSSAPWTMFEPQLPREPQLN